jgi:hypothetical protein
MRRAMRFGRSEGVGFRFASFSRTAISRSRFIAAEGEKLSHKSLQVRLKDQRPRAASMGSQHAASDGDIEQRPLYPAFARCLFKSERDSVVVCVRILAQPFADVLNNCYLMPISITKSAFVPCCNHFG